MEGVLGRAFLGACYVDQGQVLLGQAKVARGNWVNDLLVEGPDFVPFHGDDGAGGALGEDELLEALDGHAATDDTANSGHTGIVPPVDEALFNKVGQLSLRENSVLKVQTGIGPNVWFPQTELVNEPIVLVIAIHVLGGSKGVSDTFDRIDNWTGEIVSRIDIVLGAMARMRLNLLQKSSKCSIRTN